jgi:2-keto-4-pentenoate hydratase/2-oxohepta-3-ene-1,7-dioic acid hydratase in catechol pathway
MDRNLRTSKLVSYQSNGHAGCGLLLDNGIVSLSKTFGDTWLNWRDVIAGAQLRKVVAETQNKSPDLELSDVTLTIPIARPEKIICVGVNFPDRNEEYKDGQAAPANPSLFVRFPRSFVGHGQALLRPPESRQLDYEGEIVIIIGKAGRRISESKALDHIAALTLCNDGTIRDWVRHAKFNVTQGKNFDCTGSIGPWLVPYVDEDQLADIQLTTRVNGEVRQQDRTSRMIFSFRKIIQYVSTFTTLVPGDMIVTGTPTGAGARFDPPRWLIPGDVVEVEADGIGVLRNTIADEVLL